MAARRPDALAGTAPVRIFVMGIDQWRDEPDWPLPDTAYTDYYLDSSGRANTADGDGELRAEAPDGEHADTYLYDPQRPVPTLGGRVMSPTTANAAGRSTSGPPSPAMTSCATPPRCWITRSRSPATSR